MVNGSAGGQPNIWWYVSVLYNKKNDQYVAYGGAYGHLTDRYQCYTSKSPTGPFKLRRTLSAVFGGPGDTTFFVDDDNKAYLAYNAADGVLPGVVVSRFTYIYQLNEDYLDIVSSTLCNTSVSMEGLWLTKNRDTYYLLGSGLVNYDVDDDFYLTAPSPLGPWTYRGLFAPLGSRTFHSQTFKGLIVQGSKGVTHVFIGHRWCNPPVHKYRNATCDHAQAGNVSTWCCWPPFTNAISIWLPLSFSDSFGSLIPMQWQDHWLLDTDGGGDSSNTVGFESGGESQTPKRVANTELSEAEDDVQLPVLNWQQRSDWINVKQRCGAVGDGVHDDTAAIDKCLALAPTVAFETTPPEHQICMQHLEFTYASK
jgi:hypothetical protein